MSNFTLKITTFLLISMNSLSIHAATFNIADGDVTALIDAIDAANANTEADIINLASGGTYILTTIEHTLEPGVTNREGNRGLPVILGQHADLTNSRGITFNGNGATIQRDPSAPNFGLFTIKRFAGVTFNDITFKNGKVNSQGAAVFMRAKSRVEFNNCTFEDNESLIDVEGGGGCIYSVDLAEIFVTNCRFENNKAVNQGGAISVINTNIDAQDCIFKGNELTVGGGSHTPFGGAVYMDGAGRQTGHFKFDNCTFEDNVAPSSAGSTNGGGLYLFPYNDQVAEITNCIFRNNTANQGGGFSFSGGSGDFPDTWYPQTATSNFKIKFQNNTLENNHADGNGGGAFIIKAEVVDEISDCTFTDNTSGSIGGGLFLNIEDHTTTIKNVIFDSNRSDAGSGGLYFTGGGGEIDNCTFKNGESDAFGGNGAGGGLGVANNASTNVTIKNSTFNNNLGSRAGAIAFDQSGTADVYNCTFDNNIADRFGGAATVPASDASKAVSFTNCTFANNEANNPSNGQGGAIHSSGNGANTSVTITNCLFYQQTATNSYGGGGNSIWTDCSATLVDGGSNLFDGPKNLSGCVAADGTNFFSTDPLLSSLADNGGPTQTMALQSGSPAIDQGAGSGCPTTDQRGATRDADCDIGAYEADVLLPVSLTRFMARLLNNEVVLAWQTTSEINNSGFEIEHSSNGTHWRNIGFVKGYGTTDVAHTYTFLDKYPIQGVNYYRLRQIDFDDTFAYSPVASVNYQRTPNDKQLLAYPNPFDNQLTIEANQSEFEQVSVINILGQDVTAMVGLNRQSNQQLVFNTSALQTGWYIIQTANTSFKAFKR